MDDCDDDDLLSEVEEQKTVDQRSRETKVSRVFLLEIEEFVLLRSNSKSPEGIFRFLVNSF